MPISATSYIARRLYFSQSTTGTSSEARPAVRVALWGMLIGVLVMVITLCVVVGFKRTIADKVAGFGAHIQVVNYDNNNTYELRPIYVDDSLVSKIASLPNVASVQPFYTKPGIVKTDDAFQGVVVKGTDYWNFFRDNLQHGVLPTSPNEAIISDEQARLLNLHLGETFLCYFIDEKVRVRKLTISGIYRTGFSEYDELFVVTRPEVVRQLNGWSERESSGLEIMVRDFRQLEATTDRVYFATANRLDEQGNALYTQNLIQLNPQIFAWLNLLDMNVIVIIILMLAVSGFSIISGLIILILDSITLIGTLKALGASNGFIRSIFVQQTCMLVGRGLLWGNFIGLGLCALQYALHIIPLDAATYYVDYVPIVFPWLGIIALNIGIVLVSFLVLLAPSAIVARISPVDVMRFE